MKKPVLALLSIILLTAGCSQRPAATTKIPLTSAHRGAATIAPENTMASVDSCIKYGVGNIECDVCISKDSVFYVLHDSTLDRTTNGTGAISQWLSTDIDTLDAGSWFAPRLSGHFLGAYAEGGTYDFQLKKEKGYRGKYYAAAGITYGYVRPLARHLAIEFSVGIGYLDTEYRKYTSYGNDLVWVSSGKYHFIGPTKAKISLVWLLTSGR